MHANPQIRCTVIDHNHIISCQHWHHLCLWFEIITQYLSSQVQSQGQIAMFAGVLSWFCGQGLSQYPKMGPSINHMWVLWVCQCYLLLPAVKITILCQMFLITP